VRGESYLFDEAIGRLYAQAQSGQAPVQAKAAAFGKTSVSVAPKRTSVKLRLADGSETDCRAGIHLARETHLWTIFRDIPFSEAKARAIFDKAIVEPERFGLIHAVLGTDEVPVKPVHPFADRFPTDTTTLLRFCRQGRPAGLS
jgi:hypothetical protein